MTTNSQINYLKGNLMACYLMTLNLTALHFNENDRLAIFKGHKAWWFYIVNDTYHITYLQNVIKGK